MPLTSATGTQLEASLIRLGETYGYERVSQVAEELASRQFGIELRGGTPVPISCDGCGKVEAIVGPYAELPPNWRQAEDHDCKVHAFCVSCQTTTKYKHMVKGRRCP